MRTHPLSSTMPSERLTSCWMTLGGDSIAARRETDAESADRATLIRDLLDVQRRCRANVRQLTEQGAADLGCDTSRRRRPLRARLSLDRVDLA
jgi:hypothetical protein